MSILGEIFIHKREVVSRAKQTMPEKMLWQSVAALPQPNDFRAALRHPHFPPPRLIAEVKHRSPSRGVLIDDFDPIKLAKIYQQNGAAAISVLTEKKYFGGTLEHLHQISQAKLDLPLLRKDFIFDRYQILEARANGASAVLLIAAMLEKKPLRELILATRDIKLSALVEVHNEVEIEHALEAGARIIGINNRDLHNFEVNIETTLRLRRLIPQDLIVVSESGIRNKSDIEKLAMENIDAILVGEALVSAENIIEKVSDFSSAGEL